MPFDDALICSRRAASRRACAGRNSGHCWRTCMVVANNVQTRSNGVDNQVNPWSRRAGGPCPCRCRRSQQRLPQRESRPKQTELSSLEFPFLSRPREAHFRASLHRWSPAEANGSPAPGTLGNSKETVSLGTQVRGVRSKTFGRRLPLGRREAAYSTTTNSGAATIRPAT